MTIPTIPTTFYIKRHDTSPSIQNTLTKTDTGAPVDLTGATVKFTMSAVGSQTPKVNLAAAVIDDAPNGIVHYAWLTTDTDTAGQYQAEYQVTFASGAKETFPNPDTIAITITADLDNS